MANRYWHGVNTDTTDTTNWSTTRYGVTGSAAPTSSDDVFFFDGDGDVAANTAFHANTITVGGNFGGASAGLLCDTAACVITIERVGFGKNFVVGPAASTTLASMHVRSTAGGTVTAAAGSSGVLTLLQAGKVGNLVVDGSCPVTTYNNCGMTDNVVYNATAITTGQWSGGGTHTVQRTVTAGTTDGNTRVNVIANGGSPASTTLTISAGGVWAHDSDGTITTANIKPGGALLPVSTKFTVTTMNLWEGGNGSRSSDKITVGTLNPIGNPS